jgi:hypothetical protein
VGISYNPCFANNIQRKNMTEQEKDLMLIITDSMGFYLDYDQYEEKGWIRFQLKDETLQEKDFTWIVWKDWDFKDNIARGANILFKAGQKEKLSHLQGYTNLK